MTAARRVAFDVLRLVEGGGYASDLLRSRTERLQSRDAALAGEIVFGVLRFQAQLDFLIELFSGRRPERLDREVRLALSIGIYQIRYLDRVPRHAAVTESVEMVRRARKRSATGFANAVLRKVDRRQVNWPNRAVALSHPAWLLDRWERQFGEEAVSAIAGSFLKPPKSYIRIPAERSGEAAAIGARPTEIPGCFEFRGDNPGDFRRQDISSQSILALLDLQPEDRFLDLCAAPGNKTAQALETVRQAVACDIRRTRLLALETLSTLPVVLDATRPLPFLDRFNKILLDAPCSGTGTIGRNPEIKWRVQPEDLSRHHSRQVALLANATKALTPGGRLVYSTCSLEAEENEQVVEEVLERLSNGVRLVRTYRRLPGRDAGDGFWGAVLTSD